MRRWTVYYGDGSTFGWRDGAPADAPAVGVQAIVQEDEAAGSEVLTSEAGFYWWEEADGQWYACFDRQGAGFWDRLYRGGTTVLKFGRCVPNEVFREIVARANADPDMPRKSARYGSEPL